MDDKADKQVQQDIDEGLRVGFIDPQEFADRAAVDLRNRLHPHDRRHVDLSQEEYTPEEVARLLGTSKEVVLHAVRNGQLKAQRAGHDITCIKHEEVVEWLRRRGPGV